jgi:hypothetical protein
VCVTWEHRFNMNYRVKWVISNASYYTQFSNLMFDKSCFQLSFSNKKLKVLERKKRCFESLRVRI